jgi:N-acetylglucosaminyl-diphospho-decaprenol L-rhamnosyltransferase
LLSEQAGANEVQLTISIVSYNTRADLLACLESIAAAPPTRTHRTIVVDNGSGDGSVEAVRARFTDVRVVESGGNIGYGRANNLALLGAPGAAYAILNSDLVLQPGSLDRCCDYLEAHPSAGIVGGALLNPDGSMQKNWATGELTLDAVRAEQLFQSRLAPARYDDYFRTRWDHADTRALPQVCGAFMVVRSSLFNAIGGFDPAYFMYCEDTDLCRRIRDKGSECVYLHDAPAIHGHGASSTGPVRSRMVLAHNESRYHYFNVHSGRRAALEARSVMCAGARLRIALWSVAGILFRRADWRAKARGYRDVLRGTLALGR